MIICILLKASRRWFLLLLKAAKILIHHYEQSVKWSTLVASVEEIHDSDLRERKITKIKNILNLSSKGSYR
jgi:hypothetical protein